MYTTTTRPIKAFLFTRQQGSFFRLSPPQKLERYESIKRACMHSAVLNVSGHYASPREKKKVRVNLKPNKRDKYCISFEVSPWISRTPTQRPRTLLTWEPEGSTRRLDKSVHHWEKKIYHRRHHHLNENFTVFRVSS